MSKAKGQSKFRAFQRGVLDVNGNRTSVSSTKVTKSGINLPGTERKNIFSTSEPFKKLKNKASKR